MSLLLISNVQIMKMSFQKPALFQRYSANPSEIFDQFQLLASSE